MPRRDPITPPETETVIETGARNNLAPPIDNSDFFAALTSSMQSNNTGAGIHSVQQQRDSVIRDWGSNASNLNAAGAAVNARYSQTNSIPQGNSSGLDTLNSALQMAVRSLSQFSSTTQSATESVQGANTGNPISGNRVDNSGGSNAGSPFLPNNVTDALINNSSKYINPISPMGTSPQIEQLKGLTQGIGNIAALLSGNRSDIQFASQYPIHGEGIRAGQKFGRQLTAGEFAVTESALSNTHRQLYERGSIMDQRNNAGYARATLYNQYKAGDINKEHYAIADMALADVQVDSSKKITNHLNSTLNELAAGYNTPGSSYAPTMTVTPGMNGKTGVQTKLKQAPDVMGAYIRGISEELNAVDKVLSHRQNKGNAVEGIREKVRNIDESIAASLMKNDVQAELNNLGIGQNINFDKLRRDKERRDVAHGTALDAQAKLDKAIEIDSRGSTSSTRRDVAAAKAEVDAAGIASARANQSFANRLEAAVQHLSMTPRNTRGMSNELQNTLQEVRASNSLNRSANIVEGRQDMTIGEWAKNKTAGTRENINQFASMNMMNLQFALMMGFSGQLSQSMSQIPMQATYETVQPIYSSLGGITGLQNVFKEFQQFGGQAPAIMADLQGRTNSISSLMGTPYAGEAAVGKALDISKTQPVQFAEAMEIITAMATYPSTRAVADKPEFQSKMFETVQLLSMLAPEQGTGGALFALREMMGGQMRSLQMRFNISPDLLASYAGITNQELKGSSGDRLIGYMHKALTGLFGGNEILLKKGAQTDVQLNNIGDTLTAAIIKPLVMDTNTQFTGMIGSMISGGKKADGDAINRDLGDLGKLLPESQAKMLQATALQRTASDMGIKISDKDTLTTVLEKLSPDKKDKFASGYQNQIGQIANTLYGTTNGMMALLVTSLNSALDPMMNAFGTSDGISGLIGDFAKPMFDSVKNFQDDISGTSDPSKKKKLAEDFISSLIDNINDAIDNAESKMNKGALNGILGGITNVARKAAEFTFQPVARTIMVQTGKTAVDLPGMVIGGTVEAIGGSIGKMTSNDKYTRSKGMEDIVDFGQNSANVLAGVGSWFAVSQYRSNPLGAIKNLLSLGIAQRGIQQLDDNPVTGIGLLATSAGMQMAPALMGRFSNYYKIQRDAVSRIKDIRLAKQLGVDLGEASPTLLQKGMFAKDAIGAKISPYTSKYLTKNVKLGLGGAALGLSAYQLSNLYKEQEANSRMQNIGGALSVLGSGAMAYGMFGGPAAPWIMGAGILAEGTGALISHYAPAKEKSDEEKALQTLIKSATEKPLSDSKSSAQSKWTQFAKKYGIDETIDVVDYKNKSKEYGSDDIRTLEARSTYLKTNYGKYETYVQTRDNYKEAQTRYAAAPTQENLQSLEIAKANYNEGQKLYGTLGTIPREYTQSSPAEMERIAQAAAVTKEAIKVRETKPFETSLEQFNKVFGNEQVTEGMSIADKSDFTRNWKRNLTPLIQTAISSQKYEKTNKYGVKTGYDEKGLREDLKIQVDSMLMGTKAGENSTLKQQIIDALVQGIKKGYSEKEESTNKARPEYLKYLAPKINEKAFEQLYYEKIKPTQISENVFNDPTQENQRLMKTQEWFSQTDNIIGTTAKDTGKLLEFGVGTGAVSGQEYMGIMKNRGAMYNKFAADGNLSYEMVTGPQAQQIMTMRLLAGASMDDIAKSNRKVILKHASEGDAALAEQYQTGKKFNITSGIGNMENYASAAAKVGEVSVSAADGMDQLSAAIARLQIAANVKPTKDPDAPNTNDGITVDKSKQTVIPDDQQINETKEKQIAEKRIEEQKQQQLQAARKQRYTDYVAAHADRDARGQTSYDITKEQADEQGVEFIPKKEIEKNLSPGEILGAIQSRKRKAVPFTLGALTTLEKKEPRKLTDEELKAQKARSATDDTGINTRTDLIYDNPEIDSQETDSETIDKKVKPTETPIDETIAKTNKKKSKLKGHYYASMGGTAMQATSPEDLEADTGMKSWRMSETEYNALINGEDPEKAKLQKKAMSGGVKSKAFTDYVDYLSKDEKYANHTNQIKNSIDHTKSKRAGIVSDVNYKELAKRPENKDLVAQGQYYNALAADGQLDVMDYLGPNSDNIKHARMLAGASPEDLQAPEATKNSLEYKLLDQALQQGSGSQAMGDYINLDGETATGHKYSKNAAEQYKNIKGNSGSYIDPKTGKWKDISSIQGFRRDGKPDSYDKSNHTTSVNTPSLETQVSQAIKNRRSSRSRSRSRSRIFMPEITKAQETYQSAMINKSAYHDNPMSWADESSAYEKGMRPEMMGAPELKRPEDTAGQFDINLGGGEIWNPLTDTLKFQRPTKKDLEYIPANQQSNTLMTGINGGLAVSAGEGVGSGGLASTAAVIDIMNGGQRKRDMIKNAVDTGGGLMMSIPGLSKEQNAKRFLNKGTQIGGYKIDAPLEAIKKFDMDRDLTLPPKSATPPTKEDGGTSMIQPQRLEIHAQGGTMNVVG